MLFSIQTFGAAAELVQMSAVRRGVKAVVVTMLVALAAISATLSEARAQTSAPTIAVDFSPTSIMAGSASNLTFTLSNPNASTQLTGVSVQASLPANLSTNIGNASCTTVGTTISLSSSTFSISNTTLNANSSCTVTLQVTSSVAGIYSVTTNDITATGPSSLTGNSATTPTPLTVNAPSAPIISASFSPTSIASNGSSYSTLTLTISNPNASTQLTGVAVAASALPVNLSGTSPGTTCTSSTATYNGGTRSLSLSGGVLNASTSCTVTLSVFTSSPGTYSYTSGVVSASGPASVTGTNATTATPLTASGPSAAQAVASVTATSGQAVTPVTPVTGSGGAGALSYSVSPTLPAGLTLDSGTGQITGTPSASSPTTTYTVTVKDTNNATASNTFSLTVNAAVTATQSVPTASLTQNHAPTAFTPVTGAGGTGSLSFAVSPGLPTGLTFNTGNGQITGTPTATSATTTYTVTVTDSNSATASNTFSLGINSAVTATQAVPSTALTSNHTATAFTPITGGGGTGSLSYSVSPTLPTGLGFGTSTGQITGTPASASATTTYTVTVTDANGATASNTFSLTVNGAVTATQAVPSAVLTASHAATAFTPITGAGGTGTLAFSVAPTLPSGLNFNPANGQITGTPAAASSATTYTVTVTDGNGATASNTFSLTVSGPVAATQAIAAKMLTQNQPSASFTPVTGAGGSTPLSYSITPTLPAGLTFATTTGAITGTPTATLAATTFTVTVTDANSATASNTFSLTVNGGLAATQAVASTTLTANQAATPFTPVTGSGGTAPLTYSVSPSLPTGLALTSSNGSISGTPTATISATSFTVTVTDANGATASNTFSLTVNGAVTATTVVPSRTLTLNQAVTSFTPVAGSGGTGALTYAISPALSAGLSFSTTTGAIGGTPTTPQPNTTYTVTVTDANSASASSTFTLMVGQAATTVALTSSQNPSQFHQPVTFTATVTGSGAAPTGTVTFNDGGATIGTAALSGGVATLTASTLAVGSHTITASYGGSGTFLSSTSPAVAQTVNVPVDSVRLRALQANVTKQVAQSSGQAVSAAIDEAIADGFTDDGGAFLTPGAGHMRFNFTADPRDTDDHAPGAGSNVLAETRDGTITSDRSGSRGRSRISDAFAAIDQPKKALPKWREEKQWLLWADIRVSGIDRWGTTTAGGTTQATQASLYGQQVNALTGVTYKATPSFLVGFVGGWETFSYTEQDINGKLKGDGWTAGTYIGWKILPTLRYDAAVTYSGIGYNGTAGTAQGNFDGSRWMISTGLTGMYKAYGFLLEPSARVYALWEHENAYVDSLGTSQGAQNFASGRASGGLKTAYPMPWLDSGIVLTPFLGLYGDYYFTKEDAAATGGTPLASTPLLDGWSARMTGGLGAQFANGGAIGVGAEYGGLGSTTRIWTFSAKAQVPFGAR